MCYKCIFNSIFLEEIKTNTFQLITNTEGFLQFVYIPFRNFSASSTYSAIPLNMSLLLLLALAKNFSGEVGRELCPFPRLLGTSEISPCPNWPGNESVFLNMPDIFFPATMNFLQGQLVNMLFN